jgi:hypothetical protein
MELNRPYYHFRNSGHDLSVMSQTCHMRFSCEQAENFADATQKPLPEQQHVHGN